MRIHRAGYKILVASGVTVGAIILVASRIPSHLVRATMISLAVGLYLGLIQFFRNPLRVIPHNAEIALAPADGKVIAIEQVVVTEFLQADATKISIYLSLFDAHVNVAPVNGQVVYAHYHRGQYLMAFHPKSSELNEHQTLVIKTPARDQVMVRLIAGILARRICVYARQGQILQQGDEIGFIRFGSRVDIFIPPQWEVLVRQGQRVRVGVTALARRTL